MLVLEREVPFDSRMTEFDDAGADGFAGGGTRRSHAHVDFPASEGRASGQ